MRIILAVLSALVFSLLFCGLEVLAQSASTVTIGELNVLSAADSSNGNLLLAQNATLSQTATIQSLSFYVTTASGSLHLGIYDATGPNGGPGALKAQTKSFIPVKGWNTAKVVTPVSLSPGNYWLAYLPSSNGLAFAKGLTSGISNRYYSHAFGALPAHFSTSPSSDPYHWSFYATLTPGVTAVNGVCGSSNGADLTSAPTTNLCSAGAASAVTGSGPWTWSCSGNNGGTTAQCQAPVLINGSCGLANGVAVSNTPSSGLCTTGLPSAVTGSGPWNWTCAGSNRGSTALCSAPLATAITIGDTTVESAGDNGNGNLLLAQEATLSQSATIRSLSFYVTAASGNLILGIYDATGSNGGPGNLLATTRGFAPATGWNTASVVTPVALAAGNYWLAYLPSSSSLAFPAERTTGNCVYSSLTYGSLPATFSTSPWSCTPTNWSFYATLTSSGGGSAPTASLSANPTSIVSGSSATLTWSSTNATSCTGTGFSTNAVSGSASVSPTVTTNYSVSCTGTGGTVSASVTVAVTTGRVIQATDYVAANGGGDGSAANPWHGAAIQAALNAAFAGDTVYLAAGNWSLSGTPVVSSVSNITLTGAGSGNTFDAYGHPNNGKGEPVATYTRVATDTRYGSAAWLQFANCSNVTVSHIYFDGSQATAGGDERGTLNFRSCPDPYVAPTAPGPNVDDIRVLSFHDASISPETQFFIQFSNNATVQNSVFTASLTNGTYAGSQIFQSQEQNNQLIKNNLFYEFAANPFYMDNVTFTVNTTVMRADNLGIPSLNPAFGFAACSNQGCGYQAPQPSGGNYHLFVFNNFFDSAGSSIGVGGGVNDPHTGGIINDLEVSGNTILGNQAAIDSCVWHLFGSCVPGVLGGADGMKVNGFTITNNSIIASQGAILNGQGTGVLSDGQINTVIGMVAHHNYLSSPQNQYLNDQYTTNPVVSDNFGLDASSMMQAPTCSFTLGTLSGSKVPFSSTSFTAQYGSVRYLASTSPNTPGPSDSRWNYLPPISLSGVTHGSTVFMWVMDSANNISAAASATVH
jgi:hypothetical protein